MSENMKIKPGEVLYDYQNDRLVIYTGQIVQDNWGQDSIFCQDRPWRSNARAYHGCIYTGWVVQQYLRKGLLVKLGEL